MEYIVSLTKITLFLLLVHQINNRIKRVSEADKKTFIDQAFLIKTASDIRTKTILAAQKCHVLAKENCNDKFLVSSRPITADRIMRKVNEAGGPEEYVVHLDTQNKISTCTCPAYGMHGIACKHIFAVLIRTNRKDLWREEEHRDLFFHRCYFQDNLKEAYSKRVNRVFGQPLQVNTAEGSPLMPATTTTGKSFKRIPSSFSKHQAVQTGTAPSKRKRTCTKCGSEGHVATVCKLKKLTEQEIHLAQRDVMSGAVTSLCTYYPVVLTTDIPDATNADIMEEQDDNDETKNEEDSVGFEPLSKKANKNKTSTDVVASVDGIVPSVIADHATIISPVAPPPHDLYTPVDASCIIDNNTSTVVAESQIEDREDDSVDTSDGEEDLLDEDDRKSKTWEKIVKSFYTYLDTYLKAMVLEYPKDIFDFQYRKEDDDDDDKE